MHQLEPLRRHVDAQARNPRDIAARPRQAVHDTQLNGIATHLKDDYIIRDSGFRGERHLRAAGRDDDVDIAGSQGGSQGRQSCVLAFGPLIVDGDITAFDKASFAKSFVEGPESAGK